MMYSPQMQLGIVIIYCRILTKQKLQSTTVPAFLRTLSTNMNFPFVFSTDISEKALSKSALDDYNIIAHNQNTHEKYKCDFTSKISLLHSFIVTIQISKYRDLIITYTAKLKSAE